jgi:hypothetical protein
LVQRHIGVGVEVGTSVQADAKFLRRIFMGLVFLTVVTGAMAGFTTVQAMTGEPGACVMFCE